MGDLTTDQNDALGIHNAARQAANAQGVDRPDLVWDSGLADAATQYAQQLADANNGISHSGVEGQGENLYWSSSNPDTLASGAQACVNEQTNYSGQNIGDGDFGSYGHYTQVTWPTATNMGIGMATANGGGTFVVGRYTPQGNWTGKNAYQG
ncbi:hypothetical protein MMC27_008820 [Xylographa pallens]|nr:hypothetical protein [Xylographa pallens]